MRILEDILASLPGDGADLPVRDLRICLQVTAVWSRHLGLAYTFPRAQPEDGHDPPPPRRRISELSAGELARLSLSTDRVEASVGLAAINALLDPPPGALRPGNALEVILRHGAGRRVVVVGHFPFVDRLGEQVAELAVLELRPRGDDLPAERAVEVVPRADVVAITATTLINHTLAGLLALAAGKIVIVLGPTTPVSPVLFDYGVTHVCGSLVERPEEALRGVSEGRGFRHTEGLRPVILSRSDGL